MCCVLQWQFGGFAVSTQTTGQPSTQSRPWHRSAEFGECLNSHLCLHPYILHSLNICPEYFMRFWLTDSSKCLLTSKFTMAWFSEVTICHQNFSTFFKSVIIVLQHRILKHFHFERKAWDDPWPLLNKERILMPLRIDYVYMVLDSWSVSLLALAVYNLRWAVEPMDYL